MIDIQKIFNKFAPTLDFPTNKQDSAVEIELMAMSKRNLSLGEFFKIVNEGGAMLQTGEIFPPNFEYLGREKAKEIFSKFGAIYDTARKKAIFFLGDYRYCELSRAEMFDTSNAEYVKKFIKALENHRK